MTVVSTDFVFYGLMRVVIQRVSLGSVEVEGKTVGQVGPGLLLLLGIGQEDDETDADWLVKKIIQLRIFSDSDDKMNLSVQDIGGEILVISQFTLFADYKKGNRPSYIRSAPPVVAIPLYEKFLGLLRSQFSGNVACGIFGAKMKVSLVNEGPVTICMDSKNPESA